MKDTKPINKRANQNKPAASALYPFKSASKPATNAPYPFKSASKPSASAPYPFKSAPKPAAKNHRVRESIDREEVLFLWKGCFDGKAQENLSKLSGAAKDKRVRELLNVQLERPNLRGLLKDAQPKVRKNAARLISVLAQPGDTDTLADALKVEQTLFVVPSLILALGNCGTSEALNHLSAYREWFTFPEQAEEKQIREIGEALSVALSRLTKHTTRTFIDLPPVKVELLAPLDCGELLMQEAKAKKLHAGLQGDSLIFDAPDYASLFTLRCFDEAIIPIGIAPLPPLDGGKTALHAWAQSVANEAKPFEKLLDACFSNAPYPYRIELRGVLHTERAPLVHALSAALASDNLVNSPSGYDAELRLQVRGRNTQLQAKLFVPQDERFAYRINALPASIHPVTAACLLRFALPYFREGARVLDICCGSGTLLVERAKLLKANEMIGVDISMDAVRMARENIKASGEKITIIGADMLTFTPKVKFDELISNLPFGTRVGTSDKNTELYAGLIKRLDTLLSDDGVAILYTTQRSPLLRLTEESNWHCVAQKQFDAGGLRPWGMVFKRKLR